MKEKEEIDFSKIEELEELEKKINEENLNKIAKAEKDKEKSNSEDFFLQIFGKSTKIKILNFLLERETDHSLTELAKRTNVSYPIVSLIAKDFLKLRIIKETRKIGKARLFKINKNNKIVKHLLELQNNIEKIFKEISEIPEEEEEIKDKIPSYV